MMESYSKFEVNGREYKLCFTYGALRVAKKDFGIIPSMDVFTGKNKDAIEIMDLFFIGLCRFHTEDEIDEFLASVDVEDKRLWKVMNDRIERDFPFGKGRLPKPAPEQPKKEDNE
jgi:hypothetical protein